MVWSSTSVWLIRLVLAVLLLGSAGLRVLYFASEGALDLSPDEAHYWDWSRHLDWSYYSKGPLVAALIRLGTESAGAWSLQWTGTQMLAVRLPAIACGTLLLLALYVLTTQVYRREGLSLALVSLGLTIPLVTAGSSLITIDSPYTCCWAWALVFSYQAIFRESNWAWVLAGLMLALGILAKYTMILFVPSLFLFLVFTHGFRHYLWDARLWLMLLIGALGGLPILIWNLQNDWVSIRHLQGHAGFHEVQSALHWDGPFRFIGLQAALMLGYWFILWAMAMWVHRPWREARTDFRFLWWMSMTTFAFFCLFSVKNGGGEANWPVTTYLAGLVLSIDWLGRQWHAPSLLYRGAVRFCLLGIAFLGLALTWFIHDSSWAHPTLLQLVGPASADHPMPLRKLDPTCRLRGWRTLAHAVDANRQLLADRGIEPVLAGSCWNLPGELGFYCQGQPQAYSIGPSIGDRHSQYDLWHPNPIADLASFQGKTFIIVGTQPEALARAFDWLEPMQMIEHRIGDQTVARWTMIVAHGFRGFHGTPMDRNY